MHGNTFESFRLFTAYLDTTIEYIPKLSCSEHAFFLFATFTLHVVNSKHVPSVQKNKA